METILIVIHLLVVLALVGVVLLQRSEGGGLGIGGGSGFMTARGAANALTRTTAILAVAFFATSLALSLIARYGERQTDILDRIPAQTGPQVPGDSRPGSGGVLDQLGGPSTPAAPAEEPAEPAAQPTAPAAPAAPTDVPSDTPAPDAPATNDGAAAPSGAETPPASAAPGITPPAETPEPETPAAPDNSPVIPGTTPQAPSGQ